MLVFEICQVLSQQLIEHSTLILSLDLIADLRHDDVLAVSRNAFADKKQHDRNSERSDADEAAAGVALVDGSADKIGRHRRACRGACHAEQRESVASPMRAPVVHEKASNSAL